MKDLYLRKWSWIQLSTSCLSTRDVTYGRIQKEFVMFYTNNKNKCTAFIAYWNKICKLELCLIYITWKYVEKCIEMKEREIKLNTHKKNVQRSFGLVVSAV